jgi:gamma-glutamyltranspeptidase / glutathione hydrolase
VSLRPGIAAGHPATTEAGFGVLGEGGTAADAAVAASLASCVAETMMTGLAGGGHAIWFDGRTGQVRLLDFFVTVPGLEPHRAVAPLEDVGIPFENEIVHYQVGIASCAVPGVPAGLDELWRRYGKLPWKRVVEPALQLARNGVEVPPAHAACLAMLAPVMTLPEGARLYAPRGELLQAGERLEQPGLAKAFELLRDEGARTFYTGTIAGDLLGLMAERDGPVTADDLQEYEPRWREPLEASYLGLRVLTRGGLSNLVATMNALPALRGMSPTERALTLAAALVAPPYTGQGERIGDTTNLVTADADGNACVLTTSLGLGSGDFLPGLDIHLNSMLGEVDLHVEPLVPGARMESMMSPTLLLDDDGLAIAAGSAGGTRLRPALVQVLSGILDEGLALQDAVDRPRLHSAGEIVRVEPGFDEEALTALQDAGYDVRRFSTIHHYFGGVSLIGESGGAADPRRSGTARSLP